MVSGHVAALWPAWLPAPVPKGFVRSVAVTMSGFPGLATIPRVVSWDTERVVVRTSNGGLLWYEDRSSAAYRDDGRIQIVQKSDMSAYPRQLRRTRREWDAVAVRSLSDLMEVLDLGRLTLENDGDPIVLRFPGTEDDASATVRLSDESRVVLRAHGVVGGLEWRLDVTAEEVSEDEETLRFIDL